MLAINPQFVAGLSMNRRLESVQLMNKAVHIFPSARVEIYSAFFWASGRPTSLRNQKLFSVFFFPGPFLSLASFLICWSQLEASQVGLGQ